MGLLVIVVGSNPAAAEFQLGVYGGISESFDSDVTLVQQPNGTNLTLYDVPWDGKSFASPPYWGVRGVYWFDANPTWGVMIDYNTRQDLFRSRRDGEGQWHARRHRLERY